MNDAMDFAKFLLKEENPSIANTFDGNMKLQKLLAFANIISLAEFNKPLFSEPVLAYENGFVIESVRQRYKNDYSGLKRDSDKFNPDFSEPEYKVLKDTLGIFGPVPAKELSILSHTFPSWNIAIKKGQCGPFHDKYKSVVRFEDDDIKKIKNVLEVYRKEKENPYRKEVINGSTFYFTDPDVSDELMDTLEQFSRNCPEDSYTVTFEDGKLVIF